MHEQMSALACNGQFGTAHVYRSTLKSVNEFCGRNLYFDEISPELVKKYETWLRGRKLSWNTVSTYIRVIRSVYNKAVAAGVALCRPGLFRRVFTGTKVNVKRCLERESVFRLMSGKNRVCLDKKQLWVCGLAKLMFMLRGIPFVDVAYLQKNDLNGNVITYRRRKTGRLLSVTLTEAAMKLLHRLSNKDKSSPYLFPILVANCSEEAVYNRYKCALRRFNRCLDAIRRSFGLKQRISSYTIRHTWGTVAYRCEIHSGIISEAMGHSSIKVTETYLKPFDAYRLDEANRMVINTLRNLKRKIRI